LVSASAYSCFILASSAAARSSARRCSSAFYCSN
jgi:hypothetical protein